MKFNNIFKNIKVDQMIKTSMRFLEKKSPEIMIGIGIAMSVSAVYSAVRATPKALTIIEEEKRARKREAMAMCTETVTYEPVDLTTRDIIGLTWKVYAKSAVMEGLSIAFILRGNHINTRKSAAFAAAYSLSETALNEYKEKVEETIGAKKAKVIEDKVAQDEVKRIPMVPEKVVETGNGEFLFLEPKTGRYFRSSKEFIDKITVKLNSALMNEMWVPLNDFFDELGLDTCELGRDLGWNVNDGLINMNVVYTSNDDGDPCGILNYYLSTRTDYRILM